MCERERERKKRLTGGGEGRGGEGVSPLLLKDTREERDAIPRPTCLSPEAAVTAASFGRPCYAIDPLQRIISVQLKDKTQRRRPMHRVI